MKELHLLVDYENVQPSLEALTKLAPGFTDVWLFHGPNEVKKAQAIAANHGRVTLVPHSGKGKNALDFHLSFYLGYVAAKHPDAELVVVANDKGYDSMIDHAKVLGFAARRAGYKAPTSKKVLVVKPASPTATPVAARKAPAKKGVAEKAVESKAAKAVVPAKMPKPTPKLVATPEAKLLDRITKGLAKMGDKAPTKLKSLLNALKPMLDKNSTAADAEAMVHKLQDKGVVQVQGELVNYPK